MVCLCLEDHSLEIPPFLQRNKDNTLKYPGLAVASSAGPEMLPQPVTENSGPPPRLTAHDLAVIEHLRRQESTLSVAEREAKRAADADRRAAEKAKKDHKRNLVLKQKRATFQHFKWSSLT